MRTPHFSFVEGIRWASAPTPWRGPIMGILGMLCMLLGVALATLLPAWTAIPTLIFAAGWGIAALGMYGYFRWIRRSWHD